MITLDNLNLSGVNLPPGISPATAMTIARKVAWELFRKNQDVVFFKFGIGPLSITRKVRHLRGPLERVIGPEVL